MNDTQTEPERLEALRERWYTQAKEARNFDQFAALHAELSAYPHCYSSCVYAVGALSIAAAWVMASRLGITGFQASCAEWEFLRGFGGHKFRAGARLIDYEKLLYPQYADDLLSHKLDPKGAEWLREEATRNLAEKDNEFTHPNVLEHWRKVADGWLPPGLQGETFREAEEVAKRLTMLQEAAWVVLQQAPTPALGPEGNMAWRLARSTIQNEYECLCAERDERTMGEEIADAQRLHEDGAAT